MDSKIVVLNLFLKELDVPATIDTIDDRKLVQKAVYLGQLSGVDLGYRFGWYLRGPYCPSLTVDYYKLSDALESEGAECTGKELRGSIRRDLQRIKPILAPPAGVPLKQPEWLELLASVHFLQRISRMSLDEARNELKVRKPTLESWVDHAQEQLRQFGFLD